MAIYTKTGDRGRTSTFTGKRLSKASKLIAAIGAVDELNSYLGILGGLTRIQKTLFIINAILAGAKLEFPKSATQKLEREIDKFEGSLPVLKNFIVYSGTKRATQVFYARALARRAERALVALNHPPSIISRQILPYLNRLSDYLFMLARYVNLKAKIEEVVWEP